MNLFIDYAFKNSANLIVVVFPMMEDLSFSSKLYTQKIIEFFKKKNIITINVEDLAKKISPLQRVVNGNDGHPSEIIHQMVADEILLKL